MEQARDSREGLQLGVGVALVADDQKDECDRLAVHGIELDRFFRDTGRAGVDICLHALADVWATAPVGLDQQAWERQVLVVRSLLEAWWEQPETSVAPPALLSGRDLIQHLGLSPGAMIGRILESVREEQASGMVTNREQALLYAAELLREWSDENPREAD